MKLLNILKVIAFNILGFVILLFIVNWGCGLYLRMLPNKTRDLLPNYSSDPEYAKEIFKDYNSVKHQYEPFVGWKTLPYTGKTVHINNEGDRVHTPPSGETSQEKTIRFFGGSTMWGEGSDDQHTIPALVNKQQPQYNIFNHAQLAYNSRQELDALISLYSRDKKADIVIFYDGVNDAAFLCPKEIKNLPAHRLVPLFRQKLYVGKSAIAKEILTKTFTENIIRVVRLKSSTENQESPYDCLSDPNKAEEIAEIMLRNWELAHEIVTNRGGKFIAILQPAAFVGSPKTDHLTLDPELKKNFAEVYKHIKQKIVQRNHSWVYDLSDKFNGDEYIYIDFCHVSSNGNQIIANEVAKLVETL